MAVSKCIGPNWRHLVLPYYFMLLSLCKASRKYITLFQFQLSIFPKIIFQNHLLLKSPYIFLFIYYFLSKLTLFLLNYFCCSIGVLQWVFWYIYFYFWNSHVKIFARIFTFFLYRGNQKFLGENSLFLAKLVNMHGKEPFCNYSPIFK